MGVLFSTRKNRTPIFSTKIFMGVLFFVWVSYFFFLWVSYFLFPIFCYFLSYFLILGVLLFHSFCQKIYPSHRGRLCGRSEPCNDNKVCWLGLWDFFKQLSCYSSSVNSSAVKWINGKHRLNDRLVNFIDHIYGCPLFSLFSLFFPPGALG